ncbi:N-acetylmuramoyl-L-alanine amidase [Mucilaginibacter angelicae]|uniref:N-acetylmuramoyl-L-alanine amidase n=1 Tax=Mucilaginibacter angelicae TaxID=869718 RepID=A0ABV6L571_9SPHI
MQTKGKFVLMTLPEFEGYLQGMDISTLRKITHIQTHHTWSPSYRNFRNSNYFEKMESMEEDHITRGFGQIAQHYTTFPDGMIVVGRSLSLIPTCIKGHNTGGVCIENLGNFDKNQDTMTAEQSDTIVKMNALLCLKFGLDINTTSLVYHHWFRQTDGFRDNGENDPKYLNHKTCPGTAFFGGNTVDDATKNFLPPVQLAYDQYKQNMVAGTQPFKSGTVNADLLNIRSGPGKDFPAVGQLKREAQVIILETNDDWDRIGDNQWVFADYIALNT